MMEKSLILRPNGLVKAKQSVSLAEKNDLSGLMNFDDPSMTFRERIMAVETRLLELPQVEIPIEHHFGAGIYARTMIAPRGTVLTGRIYKVPQMIILNAGEITVRSENFNGRIRGPHIYNSPVGAKRFGYCHTEVVWTCLTSVKSTDVESAEKEIYAETYEELEKYLDSDNMIFVEV
jgi:hypothetical protein